MAVQKKIKSHPFTINYFKELPFYNIFIEKPKIQPLKNIDLLSELPIYEELIVIKTYRAVKEYTMSYKIELDERKDPLIQLETSKTNINDLSY